MNILLCPSPSARTKILRLLLSISPSLFAEDFPLHRVGADHPGTCGRDGECDAHTLVEQMMEKEVATPHGLSQEDVRILLETGELMMFQERRVAPRE